MAQRGITNHNLPHYTHNTYDVLFYNDTILTTVTHDATVVSNWISSVEAIHRRRLTSLIVGLDCEWRPTYTRHLHYPVATLQLSVGRRCLIYQIIHSRYIPDELYNFLSNPNYTFVGVGVEQDVEKLQQDYELGFDMKYVDLRSLAVERYDDRELKQAGLKRLAMEVLGKEMVKPKRVTMSRWDHRWLTNAQVEYACLDAFVSFEIGRVLHASS